MSLRLLGGLVLALGVTIPVISLRSAVEGPDRTLAGSPEPSPQTVGVLGRYLLSEPDPPTSALPASLVEVSGLAFDPEGRLLAHADEVARIHEVDPESGRVVTSYEVGRGLRGDWEGIAVAGERIFLVDSDGVLLEFRRGRPGEVLGFRRTETGLGRRCEVEGLAYDILTESLLLACKTARSRSLRDRLAVFAVTVADMRLEPSPRILLELEELEAVGLGDWFRPSGLEIHPVSGTILLTSAAGGAILEVERNGRPVAGRRMPTERLPQLEGVAVDSVGRLYLASEGGTESGRLARFEMQPTERPR